MEAALPVLRTLDDARWLAAAARQHRQAVLVGAGFIGLEVAASLRKLGLDVTVLESAPIPLKNSLGPELADWLCSYHASCGVRIEAGVQIRAIATTDGAYEITLGDGRRLEAGFVLAGIGVEPNTDELNQLITMCRDKKVRLIAVEPQYSANTSAKTILDELRRKGIADAELVEIDPLETVTPDALTAEWYEMKMRKNLEALRDRMK